MVAIGWGIDVDCKYDWLRLCFVRAFVAIGWGIDVDCKRRRDDNSEPSIPCCDRMGN